MTNPRTCAHCPRVITGKHLVCWEHRPQRCVVCGTPQEKGGLCPGCKALCAFLTQLHKDTPPTEGPRFKVCRVLIPRGVTL